MAFTAKDAKILQNEVSLQDSTAKTGRVFLNMAPNFEEKQKMKINYGIQERQFRSYFEKALKQSGVTGENLLSLLERRLDNVVYRLFRNKGTSQTACFPRFFEVNGKKRIYHPTY